MALNNEQILQIQVYKKQNPPLSDVQISERMKISRASVIKYKNVQLDKKNKQILNSLEKAQQKQMVKLYEMVEDNRAVQIVDKIYNGINKQTTIDNLLTSERGIGVLNTIMGTLLDKAIKVQELNYKRQLAELGIQNNVDEGYNDNYIITMQKQSVKVLNSPESYIDPSSKPS